MADLGACLDDDGVHKSGLTLWNGNVDTFLGQEINHIFVGDKELALHGSRILQYPERLALS